MRQTVSLFECYDSTVLKGSFSACAETVITAEEQAGYLEKDLQVGSAIEEWEKFRKEPIA